MTNRIQVKSTFAKKQDDVPLTYQNDDDDDDDDDDDGAIGWSPFVIPKV